jgi:hypothetical protein
MVEEVIATSNSRRVKPPYFLLDSPITTPVLELNILRDPVEYHSDWTRSYIYYDLKQGKPASVDGLPFCEISN